MELIVTREGGQVFFEIGGDIDESGADKIKSRFRQLNTSAINEAVFDFSKVRHIGSAGIGKLLLIYKDLAINGGSLRIENASEAIYELMRVLKLDTIFKISRDPKATSSFTSRSL